MSPRFARICAIAGCLTTLALAAPAAPTDTSTLVFIGGIPILRIRSSAGGKTPQQRAQEVQLRLNHALSVGPVKPSDIQTGQLDGDWVVFFQGKRFLTADLDTAKAEHLTPQALVEEWATRMRHVLPGLTKPHGVAK